MTGHIKHCHYYYCYYYLRQGDVFRPVGWLFGLFVCQSVYNTTQKLYVRVLGGPWESNQLV